MGKMKQKDSLRAFSAYDLWGIVTRGDAPLAPGYYLVAPSVLGV